MSATELDGLIAGAEDPAELVDEPYAPELAFGAPEPLAAFNRAGVLSAADIRVALALGALADLQISEPVGRDALLAAALAVRAPRQGHVFVDLATVRDTVAVDAEAAAVTALPWPEPKAWMAALASAPALVAIGEADAGAADAGRANAAGANAAGAEVRPLRLIGPRLYLDRYWREERELAAALRALATAPPRPVELGALATRVSELFPGPGEQLQRAAAVSALLRGLTVIAGGPGTGKTTTVARLCALLAAEAAAAGRPAPLLGLCAPTGKAAARLQEAVREEAAMLSLDESLRESLIALRASTIHRLLGWRPRSHSRFRHDAANRLPHDVVIVDETSMVPLTLMARLLEAIRDDARLVLVGDPDQLTAVEAGAVLRDIVGPAATAPALGPGARALLERVIGGPLPGAAPPPPSPEDSPGAAAGAPGAATPATSAPSFGDGIVVLRRGHRFGAAIGVLADAVRRGDEAGAVAAARSEPSEITWIEGDFTAGAAGADAAGGLLGLLRDAAVEAGVTVHRAALAGEAGAALAALGAFRLLCAHRHGPYGVAAWSATVERWLAGAVAGFSPGDGDYAGRPLMIVRNDYELRLHNGDTGVVILGRDGRLTAAFERDGQLTTLAPSRLEAVETVYATTVHKSQGSQFGTAAVLLPAPDSRLLSRELLYTAITRARQQLILAGTEESLRVAVRRPVARASGLRERLWDLNQRQPPGAR